MVFLRLDTTPHYAAIIKLDKTMKNKIISLIRLLRPTQWLKNLFVFLPMFFGNQLLNEDCWILSLFMALAFMLMSSAIYCINDIVDINDDRLHPRKKFRPVASGQVSIIAASTTSIALAIGAFAICWLSFSAYIKPIAILAIYLLINLAYCFKLKQFAIIDVMIISLGFVLRLIGGGVVCDIWLSPWIVMLTFLLALFMAFAKRRDDLILTVKEGVATRCNVTRYNLSFMNIILGMLGAVTIVCYVIYTVSPEVEARIGSQYVYISSIFVIAGILRYLQIAIVDINSGSPTSILLHDRFIQGCIICWIAQFLFMIYL